MLVKPVTCVGTLREVHSDENLLYHTYIERRTFLLPRRELKGMFDRTFSLSRPAVRFRQPDHVYILFIVAVSH